MAQYSPFSEMLQLVKMMKDRRFLQVHEGMIRAYMENNDVSREDAIAALQAQGLVPKKDKR